MNASPTQMPLNLPNPLAARASLFLSTDGQPFTTSRAVADRFGKRHDNVVRDIVKLLAQMPDPQFSLLNFEEREFRDTRGKTRIEYRITHNGFAVLAMGFTGTDALAWKIAFLDAFNFMEAKLQERSAKYVRAMDTLHPCLRPVTEGTEQHLRRDAIGAPLGKSAASVTYHRRKARHLGLLPARGIA